MQLINALTPLEEARAILAESFDLKFTKAVERVTARVYDKVKDRIPEIEWPFYAPLILQINRLKKEKDAVILAHNYQAPQIYHGVADIVGDSLQLAIEATKVKQQVIVQCGVHFMAETSKILNPKKTVLIPDSRAGCSLASSITPEDVIAMRAQYPGVPVITFFCVFLAVLRARYWSGIMITVSPATPLTISAAFDEVQQTSVTAFTAAEVLT